MGGTRRLDGKEQKFALCYIESGNNAYQSAIKAGYKESTAKFAYHWITADIPDSSRNLPYKPYLVEYINKKRDEILAKTEKSVIASVDEILKFHTDVMRNELEGTRYNKIEVRQRSAEDLAKYLGLEKQKIDLNGTINNPFEGLTTEQLIKIVEGES